MIPSISLLPKNYQYITMLMLLLGTVRLIAFIDAFMDEDFVSSTCIRRLFMESTLFQLFAVSSR